MPQHYMHILKVFNLHVVLHILMLCIYDLFKDTVSNSETVSVTQ
jgi:hypothetical protein